MKENSINQMLDEKNSLRSSAQAIIDTAKNEKRQFNDAENVKLAEIRCQLAELDLKIDEKRSSLRGQIDAPQAKKEFSLVRAIRNQITGKSQDDVEARMLEAGAKFAGAMDGYHGHIQIPIQTRAGILTGASGLTNGAIDTENQGVVLPLENNLVLAQAGATIMSGLKGNIKFPTIGAANVAWAAENAAASDQTPAFGNKELTPHRLTAYFDISNQLLAQENQSVENYLRQLIASAISQKLESTLLGSGSSVANTPDGLFATIATANKGALSWGGIVGLETAVSAAGGLNGNLAYILHPSLIGKAKTTAKETSGAGGLMINDNGLLNGYKCFSSANVATGLNVGSSDNTGVGAIFGNWSDLVIGNWNSIGIELDPYTQNIKGVTRIVVHSWWDAAALRAGSFCPGSFKL